MNLFDKAKANATKPTTAKVDGKKKKHEVQLAGLESVAQIDALIKTLEGVKKTVSASVKDEAMTEFMALASNGLQPENFVGLDGKATASVEMRRRATSSPLSDAEIEVLTKANLPTEEIVTVEEVFVVNPVYANDQKKLMAVSKAIEKLVPDDFFMLQPKVSKTVVSEATLAEAFKNHVSREVIEMITVLALKPQYTVSDMASLFEAVKKVVTGEVEPSLEQKLAASIEAAKAKKAK